MPVAVPLDRQHENQYNPMFEQNSHYLSTPVEFGLMVVTVGFVEFSSLGKLPRGVEHQKS